MLHISDIKKFMRCDKLYSFELESTNAFKPYLRIDESINDLLVSYFGIKEYFLGVRNDDPKRFFAEYDNYRWFIHPRFMDGELRINIPLMYKDDGSFNLFFIAYNTYIKDLDLIQYRIVLRMLKKFDINVKNIYVVYFDGDYVNDGILDATKLFICTDTFKEEKIIDITRKCDFDYESIISQMINIKNNEIKSKKNKNCKQNGLCNFYNKCFPNEEELPNDSILTLVSSAYKNKMYENGIDYLKDVNLDLLEGNRIQYAQIMASKNGGLFIDKFALKEWLKSLNERPISFIDFEWDTYIVPPYKNMKPLDVLCFEFALYYLDEKGNIEHKTFVGTGDCREEFIKKMIEYLPTSGPILAYNADGAEKLRLEELAYMFPQYEEKLNDINNRFIDLATPFISGLIYDVRMQGNYSLKKLVDICSNYSYKDLDIYDGLEAVYNWRDIDNGQCINSNKIINELEEYCSLDAYGLFLVYKWLLELIVESN